ncbi:MAG: YraN family protein [Thermoanaerobacterales bacterium]|nr:YraN family protein [Thermoanaerobacterales bacterium]
MERKERGIQSEATVEAYLRRQGYRILARNFRCRMGELDLVALDGNELVFVEVRSRASTGFGLPEESVARRKQQRLRRAAQCYLLATGQPEAFCRFDVVGVVLDGIGRACHIEHIKDAFR